MKTTLPFDTQFRMDLENYEDYMASLGPVTSDQQFDATYDDIFKRVIGSYRAEGPILIGIDGTQMNMIQQVSNLKKIDSLEGSLSGTSDLIVPYYNGVQERPMTELEATIFTSDLNEWFHNSGFPGFTATLVMSEDAMFPGILNGYH